MPNKMLIDIYASRAAALRAEAAALGALEHNLLKGKAREILVKQLLIPLLHPTIQTLSGSIINAGGYSRTERNEDDLVLFDPTVAPVLWQSPGVALIPIEGVRAHIEVKSILTAADVRAAVNAAAELIEHSIVRAPAGIVFAYDDGLRTEETNPLNWLLSAVESDWRPSKGQASSPIQCICVAGKGTWLLTNVEGRGDGWYFVPADSHHELLAFGSVISNYLYIREDVAPDDATVSAKLQRLGGAGRYLLDPGWITGPIHPVPLVAA